MKMVVANMKMNLLNNQIIDYINEIDKFNFDKNVIICPSNIYIPYFLNKKYDVGIQNVFFEDKGAFTGEVSCSQIKSQNIDKIIIGHSERRNIFGETDEIVNKKIKKILSNNLSPILCVGENIDDYQNQKTNIKIANQLTESLKDINNVSKLIIAYEPVWSIGTGNIPTISELEKVVKFINDYLIKHFNTKVPILYGGSVDEENIQKIKNIKNLSGVLIGSSSLNPDTLNKIVRYLND